MATCLNPEALETRVDKAGQPSQRTLLLFPRPAPQLPLLPATRLQLEWYGAEPSMPLNTLCRIILGDAGATMELLRCAGEDAAGEPPAFARVEDCIAGVDLRSWLARMQQAPPALGPVAVLWRQARQLAVCAQQLVPRRSAIPPHLAYLGAMLHAAADVRALPGWEGRCHPGTDRASWLTRLGSLPAELTALLRQAEQPDSLWSGLLAEAGQKLRSTERVA